MINVILLIFLIVLTGASVFGSDKRFAPFYSFGLGWNINQEKFMEGLLGWTVKYVHPML